MTSGREKGIECRENLVERRYTNRKQSWLIERSTISCMEIVGIAVLSQSM